MKLAPQTTTTPVQQRFFGNIGSGISDVTHSIGRIKELRNRVDELTRQNTSTRGSLTRTAR